MMAIMKCDMSRRRPRRRQQLRSPPMMLVMGCLLLLLSLISLNRVDGQVLVEHDNGHPSVTNNESNKRSLRYGSSYYYSYKRRKSPKGSKSSKRGYSHYYGYKSSKSSKSDKYGHYGSISHYRHSSYGKRPSKDPYYAPSYGGHHEPALFPIGNYVAPSYFQGGYHSPVSYPRPYPNPGYGHAPSENGGIASPSYFVGVGHSPSRGDPDPWGGGGKYAPSLYGYGHAPSVNTGHASPSYFSNLYGTPSYGDPDPWSGSPNSYWNPSPVAYGGGYGAPQGVGYGGSGGYSNLRPKTGYGPGTPENPVKAPVQAPANFRNPGTPPTTAVPQIDFRIPGSPAIAPASAPFASSETPAPNDETPAPDGGTPAPSIAETPAPNEGTPAPSIEETPVPNGDVPTQAPSEIEGPTPSPSVVTPAPSTAPTQAPIKAPVPITSEDMPSFNSGDMPVIMGSNDLPSMIVTGPDDGPTPNAMPAVVPTDSTPAPDESPSAPTSDSGGNLCPEGEGGAGCDMCVGSEVVDPGRIVTIDVPGTGNTETATCAEWFGVGCEFVEPDLCADYQEALVDCCIIAPPAGLEPTTSPAPSSLPVEGGNSCFDPAGCDVCGDESLVDNSRIVTIDNPESGLTETATCGEWFLFGCGFIEPDVCEEYQDVLGECCTGPDQGAELPTMVYTPAMTPSMLSPAMFTPSMMTPSMLTPAMMPVMLDPLATQAPSDVSAASDVTSFEQAVAVDPFGVRFVGDFDLTIQTTSLITNAINGLMAPYLDEKMGKVLASINLDIDLKNATDDTGRRDLRELESNTIALFGISGTLNFSSDSPDDLVDFTTQRVTNDVKGFFSGTTLEDLLSTLRNNGLTLDEIEMHDGSTDSIVTDEGPTTQTTNDGGDSTTQSSGNNNMTAVIIATLCGGFVFIVLAVALFVNIRKRKRKFNRAQSQTDNLNLRSGGDELPDASNGGSVSHVSFPHLLGEEGDEDDLEYMDDDTLRAIKGRKKKPKKKKSRGERFHEGEQDAVSWASISITSDKKGKKKRKKSKRHVHSVNEGVQDDVYLAPDL